MSLARVFCSWSIAAVLLLLSISFSNSAKSEKSLESTVTSTDEENGEEGNGTASNNVTLTGNPQIDYIHDPNLPRELNGYNLSDYPFYNRVPKNINFSCDGRKDGFYASIEHKCQIYHHCLFGSRFDFICANYTAFDQRTFICQFVSDVDCPNSHMFYHRNKDLYVSKSTTTIAPFYDRSIYERRRPPKKPKSRLRPASDDNANGDGQQPSEQSTSAPATSGGEETAVPAPPKKANKDADYYEDDYYEDDYQVRRPRPRRRFRNKCRNGRRRGRRCRVRRPYYYDEEDYAYDDDYDYAYYDDARPRKAGKKKRPLNAISAGTSQVTSTSSSETPPPTTTSQLTTTTTTTTEPPMYSSTSSELDPLDSESITGLQKQRDELFTRTRRPLPNVRPPALQPSTRQDKLRSTSQSGGRTPPTTTTTTTEKAKPPPTTTTTTTTTEVPQYIYDYEYYEDDTPVDTMSSTTTTTTTQSPNQPYFRGKIRSGNNAAALLEKQRVQQSIQVRVTEDQGTNTNTIRRRDNSNVQTPTRVAAMATPPPVVSTSSTHHTAISSTTAPSNTANRPARFWQRKSTVKSISSTTAPSTTTTTLAPFYQEYSDYEDMVPDPQPSVQSLPPQQHQQQQQQHSNKFQPLLNPQLQQYGTSSRHPYGSSTGPSVAPQQQYATSPRGHSLSSSSYAPPAPPRPNKNYAMQQYSQSSSSSSISNSNSNNNNNYNTNSYHRQRSPQPPSVVPKPEFISLVDEDYNNPYVTQGGGGAGIGPTSPSSARFSVGGSTTVGGGSGGGAGYHQHPIRYFEQHQPPAFLFGAASEYNSPRFAFPPRSNFPPSPSNFQPYGHSTRRFSPHHIFKK